MVPLGARRTAEPLSDAAKGIVFPGVQKTTEIGLGEWSLLDAGDPGVLAVRYDREGTNVLCLHNLAETSREVRFATGLDNGAGGRLVNLLGEDHSEAGEDGCHRVLLEGYGYR